MENKTPLLNVRRWGESESRRQATVVTDNWGEFYVRSFYFRDPRKSYDIIVHNP